MTNEGSPKEANSTWAKTVATLGVVGIIAEGITHSEDIWKFISKLCCAPQPSVRVQVLQGEAVGGGDCLSFAFEKLPASFRLGEIALPIENPMVANLPGDQAAAILQTKVKTPIADTQINSKTTVRIECLITATQEDDAFFIKYCPYLKQRGEYAKFDTKPVFFSPGESDPIRGLQVKMSDNKTNISITLKHPKNLEVANADAEDCSETVKEVRR